MNARFFSTGDRSGSGEFAFRPGAFFSALSATSCKIWIGALSLLGFVLPLTAAGTHHLFAFDDHALPFKSNLKLTFVAPRKHPANPVLAPGPIGSVDAMRAQFYGSVIRVGTKFRMWYCALSGSELKGNMSTSARLAYAESEDGIRWVKPELGLTEFNGNKHNNLLGMPACLDFTRTEPLCCFVLYEPDDPDPGRRYKMAAYGRYYPSSQYQPPPGVPAGNIPSTLYPFVSSDGLTWKLAVPAPKNGKWFDENEAPIRVRNNFELGGLYKFGEIYYAAGQELSPDIFLPDGSIVRRTMVTHWSGDFVTWSQEKSFSFQRHGYRSVRQSLQEAHEPAAVWHRGNMLIGVYGLWHGAVIPSERRMDLGFLVSNDGIHFREPIADHVFIPAGHDGEWDQRGLVHGQGFENVGEETYIYYGCWDLSGAKTGYGSGAVGLAILPRDRLAGLSTRDPGGGSFVSEPISNEPARRRTLSVNADGLSDHAFLRVELIDRKGEPVPGYSGAAAAIIKTSGLQTNVTWPGGTEIRVNNAAYRVRVTFAGERPEQATFYVAYLE